VAQQQSSLHQNQEQHGQSCMEQQHLYQMPTSSGCRHWLTASVQPDVWSSAASTLIRNRGALQAKLASRCDIHTSSSCSASFFAVKFQSRPGELPVVLHLHKQKDACSAVSAQKMSPLLVMESWCAVHLLPMPQASNCAAAVRA
jgi:hypothetical protein